ncbi:1-phosphofructokinase family hexose kinase [Salegentibacter sediminis]|uniref:1-phosphofructokinase family hexose kinase n=1 Tax=Salegentibacter sediminis TaxID=1930251 RepID=UPI0009C1A35C|nr:1-phosphofructokinase family hexose kinase [Salegentibacter sediminis]
MILNLCPNPSIDSYARIPDFKLGEVNRISALEDYPGGKGVHVALAIAELGFSSKLLGFWAGGSGDWIIQECKTKKVEIDGVNIRGNNRKCYTFISENTKLHHTELLEPGPKINHSHFEEFITLFNREVTKAEFICMSGSWPAESPNDGYAQLIEIAKKYHKKVILDCTGIQLQNALKEGFFGIHLNHHEAKTICGATDIRTLREFLGDKVQFIVLTKGAEGLELAYRDEIIKAKISLPPSQVISTVGSGDCLTAGIALALNQKLKLSEIATWGVACGTANCLNKELGMLKKQDVEKMLKQVQIETYE